MESACCWAWLRWRRWWHWYWRGWRFETMGRRCRTGRFGLWMFWAAVMLTLPQILSWFSGFGLPVPVSAGGGTALFQHLQGRHNQLCQSVRCRVPRAGARRVDGPPGRRRGFRGRSPLYSILGAMFLLSIAATQALMRGEPGTKLRRRRAGGHLDIYGEPDFSSRGGPCHNRGHSEFRVWQAGDAACLLRGRVSDGIRAMAVGRSDDVTPRAYELLSGITKLTNWMGDVIMPTVAGLSSLRSQSFCMRAVTPTSTSPGRG